MEAPEKIYLVKDENTDKPMDYWYTATTDDSKVEYIRTDAFMEKARKYLQRNLWRVVDEEPEFIQRFVTDFEYYMKGENGVWMI